MTPLEGLLGPQRALQVADEDVRGQRVLTCVTRAVVIDTGDRAQLGEPGEQLLEDLEPPLSGALRRAEPAAEPEPGADVVLVLLEQLLSGLLGRVEIVPVEVQVGEEFQRLAAHREPPVGLAVGAKLTGEPLQSSNRLVSIRRRERAQRREALSAPSVCALVHLASTASTRSGRQVQTAAVATAPMARTSRRRRPRFARSFMETWCRPPGQRHADVADQ